MCIEKWLLHHSVSCFKSVKLHEQWFFVFNSYCCMSIFRWRKCDVIWQLKQSDGNNNPFYWFIMAWCSVLSKSSYLFTGPSFGNLWPGYGDFSPCDLGSGLLPAIWVSAFINLVPMCPHSINTNNATGWNRTKKQPRTNYSDLHNKTSRKLSITYSACRAM